ncbi:MAG: hypothetical protein FJ207_04565 [Gemmatimonadetes bacterium]|nr:hypothetical protein [Gemmatimonadota bacterium]
MVRLVCAWMLVNGLILAPSWIPAAVHGYPLPWASVEAALLVGAAALLPRRRWSVALVWVVSCGLVLLAMALFADVVFFESLGRPLDLSLDLYLLDAVWRLSVGNLGLAKTVLWFVAVIFAAGLGVAGTGWLLAPTKSDASPSRPGAVRRVAVGLASGAVLAGLVGFVAPPIAVRFPAPGASFLRAQVGQVRARRAERVAFDAELAADPRAFAELPGLLARLEGRSVALVYLESYGMATLEDPQFGAVVRPLLDSASTRLEAAGIRMLTGSLVSPTLGGQSWYAHGTMLSGLWLENQLRYQLLLTSDRETLIDDFRRAGYRTATVMPAITTPWPEAVRIGYDEVHTAQNMPYAGPQFYWVTMPDQFTWSFLGALLREAQSPLFVEVGMVSSHAPWTPVVPLVDWDAVGDGSAFEAHRVEGEPPENVWWDVDSLRVNYAQSMVYSLEAMTQFAERYLDDRTLLIVAGDHQAAPWVTGSAEPDVPVHVFARDAEVLEPFRELGFVEGPLPDPARPPRRMDEFRGWFVGAYSGGSAIR